MMLVSMKINMYLTMAFTLGELKEENFTPDRISLLDD